MTISNLKSRLFSSTLSLLADKKTLLSSLAAQLRYLSPERRIQSERQRVDELARRALSALVHNFQLQKKHIQGTQSRLEALSPLAVLARGYAVVTRKVDGSVVSRVAQTEPGQQIQIRVSDGQLDAEIVDRKS